MEESGQAPYTPGAKEVIEALGLQVDGEAETFERCTIQRVSDSYYVSRIYFGASDEYEGYHLDFS